MAATRPPGNRRTRRSRSSRSRTGSNRPRRTERPGTASRSRPPRRSGRAARPRTFTGCALDEEESAILHGLVLGLQRHSRQPRPRLRGGALLAEALGGLEARDLILDRGEQPVTFGKLALDRLPLGRAIGDDLHLLRLCPLQPRPPKPDLGTEALHLAEDARVLSGYPLDGVEPVHEVVDRPGSEEHVERGALVAADVQRDEALATGGSGRSSGPCARSRDDARSSSALPGSARASRWRGCTPRPPARAARRSPGSARARSAPRHASSRSGQRTPF